MNRPGESGCHSSREPIFRLALLRLTTRNDPANTEVVGSSSVTEWPARAPLPVAFTRRAARMRSPTRTPDRCPGTG